MILAVWVCVGISVCYFFRCTSRAVATWRPSRLIPIASVLEMVRVTDYFGGVGKDAC
jgi:hypothetical protein